MQMSRVEPRVFLSYSHKDKPIARELSRELEQRGAAVWFDEQMIAPGDNWSERIGEAIRNSDVFLLLVSPASARSAWVRRELDWALEGMHRTRVIPVCLAGVKMPSDLSGVLYLDADSDDLGAAADRVLGSSAPQVGQRIETGSAQKIEEVLSTLDLAWWREPAIAGVRPDFLVETPDGKRLVIEVKRRPSPSLLEAVDARSQAAHLRTLTGADDAVVVFPYLEKTLPIAGLVGLTDLASYLRDFRATSRLRQATTDRPEPRPTAEEKVVFASMPFAPQYEDVYWVAMTYAAEAVGATCVRVDRQDFDGDIPEKIKTYIESSIVIIADLSESNSDVLYEVGYARRHGCPCVHICSTPLDGLPFNVRNINTLRYEQGQTYELREPLRERLRSAINGQDG
jgi:hypothetical protein